jgi:hypothetical protein
VTRPPWMLHRLKTWHEPFQAILEGRKKFEFRKTDREFRVGDSLQLREYDPETDTYSGREIRARITYLLSEGFGLQDGFCVMSIKREYSSVEGVAEKYND